MPVSCCNTTNPLVNEKMCLDIAMDIDVTDITELIYTEVLKLFMKPTHYAFFCFFRAVSISLRDFLVTFFVLLVQLVLPWEYYWYSVFYIWQSHLSHHFYLDQWRTFVIALLR